MVSIAISFLVMIIAVSVSSGFRREIRSGIASVSGDIQLTPADMNYIGEESPVSSRPPGIEEISALQGVEEVVPVIYRAGIVRKDDAIHGVVFKGLPAQDSLAGLGVSIPDRLASILEIGEGDDLQAYFVGERVKARKFTVRSVYRMPVHADDNLVVLADIGDMRRLNGWEEDEVSALEITLDDSWRQAPMMTAKKDEIGTIALLNAGDGDDMLVASSLLDKYPQLFDWLNLIDFNALAVLLLMTVVAGFNMISGLLILLFRNISTIGTLKALGMTDRHISSVFLRVSSNLVLKGMLIGNAVALALCALQNATHVLKLNPDNYFIPYVPLKVDIPMIIIADALAYGVIMLLLLIPVRFISKVDPAVTVRAQ